MTHVHVGWRRRIQCGLDDSERGTYEDFMLALGQHVNGFLISISAVVENAKTVSQAHLDCRGRMRVPGQPYIGFTRLLAGGAHLFLAVENFQGGARLQRAFTRKQEFDDFRTACSAILDECAYGLRSLAMVGDTSRLQISGFIGRFALER